MNNCLVIVFLDPSAAVSADVPMTSEEELFLQVTGDLPFDKLVLYPEIIDPVDGFSNGTYAREIQANGQLGARLDDAFRLGFDRGYDRVVLIRSVSPQLDGGHVIEAMDLLDSNQAVIGPTDSGDYYLLGLTTHLPQLFRNKDWGGNDLVLDTLLDLKGMQKIVAITDTLPESLTAHMQDHFTRTDN